MIVSRPRPVTTVLWALVITLPSRVLRLKDRDANSLRRRGSEESLQGYDAREETNINGASAIIYFQNYDGVTVQDATGSPVSRRSWSGVLTHTYAGGIALTIGAIGATLWSITGWSSYSSVVVRTQKWGWLSTHALGSPRLIAENLLLVAFFFLVGIELSEELRSSREGAWRTALLPTACAVTGMAATAVTWIAISHLMGSGHIASGWGVPMATDTAFTLGALSLVGTGVPKSLRVFLLALAVGDDIFSVIALAATKHGHVSWAYGAAAVLAVGLLAALKPRRSIVVIFALAVVWFLTVSSGVEPALAGVAVGAVVRRGADGPRRALHLGFAPVVNGLVLPIFALASCGYDLHNVWSSSSAWRVIGVVFIARIVGKFIGIGVIGAVFTRWLVVDEALNPQLLLGASVLCAVGFTVPLLFAASHFGDASASYSAIAAGLSLASLVAAGIGVVALRRIVRRSRTQ